MLRLVPKYSGSDKWVLWLMPAFTVIVPKQLRFNALSWEHAITITTINNYNNNNNNNNNIALHLYSANPNVQYLKYYGLQSLSKIHKELSICRC